MTEYELSRLPATDFGKRAIRRVSPVYEQSFFYKKFLDALGADYDVIRNYFEGLRRQRFIQTVDWGIEYLEHKYSVPVDRSLDLETRRARLGMKAFIHRPLNPGVLEKTALEQFGLATYLNESESGYIGVEVNSAGEPLFKFLKWLLIERPAHLALKVRFHWFHYVDAGEEFSLPDKFTREIPLPKTPADKKNFPRLFAGTVVVKHGTNHLPLPIPKRTSFENKLFGGTKLVLTGAIKIPATAAVGTLDISGGVRAGTVLIKTGLIRIN